MILDTTSKSVQIVLGEPAAPTACDVTASYVDQNYTAQTLVPGANDLTTNGTMPITAVAAPASGVYRQIKEIHVYNNDTINHSVYLQLLNGATTRIIRTAIIAPKQTFDYYWDGLVGAPGAAGAPGPPGPPGSAPTVVYLGAASSYTLADGLSVGQQTWIEDNNGTAQSVQPVINGTFVSGSSIQFNINYQSVICLWDGSKWGLF